MTKTIRLRHWFDPTWFYATLLNFLIRYRRTVLGPLWLLVGPSLFIIVLGSLYSEIGAADPARFVPHLTIGYVVWTLVSGVVNQAPTIYQRNRAQIMQGSMSLEAIVSMEVMMHVIAFLHQLVIVAAVLAWYHLAPSWYALMSLVGLGLVIANGLWVSRVFGILGARYRDLAEVFQAVMRIAFLATPIIWMPGEGARGGVMGAFLVFNPFYHFLEVVRAPLLGQMVAPLSWFVVGAFTLVGYCVAHLMEKRYNRLVPLWI